MAACIALAVAFPSALFYQPSGCEFHMIFAHRIHYNFRELLAQGIGDFPIQGWILEKTTCINQYFGIRQLALPDGSNGLAHISNPGLFNMPGSQFLFYGAIFEMHNRVQL